MNKKYSELAELFRSEKTDEEILDFLLNYRNYSEPPLFKDEIRVT
ncbi:hypothetical protein [Waltera sp.]